jgi:hypothetical protein
MFGVAILGGCVLLGGVLYVGSRLWNRAAPELVAEADPKSPSNPRKKTAPDPETDEPELELPGPPQFVGPPEPPPDWAANTKVRQAINQGVAFLKERIQKPVVGEQWAGVGANALVGLALLECDVPADDPVIQKIAAQVRDIQKTGNTSYMVYEYSVAVWFLERLGDEKDRPLIRTLALRLIAAQTVNGGWGYPCPPLTDTQQTELIELLATKVDAAAPVPKDAALASIPSLKFRAGDRLTMQAGTYDDNSNTQFAILALWAARKYGVPVERPLAMVEARMRVTQVDSEGSWGYYPTNAPLKGWCGSMTCAGLMGLAVARGVRPKDDSSTKPMRDLAVEKGVQFLGQTLGKKLGDPSIPAPPKDWTMYTGKLLKSDSGGDLYFLWSLERMAVVYDWQKIGDVDWYVWGSALILPAQQNDGSWMDSWSPSVDTAFALLFLKRANVVKDLTVELKSRPIEIEMKGK